MDKIEVKHFVNKLVRKVLYFSLMLAKNHAEELTEQLSGYFKIRLYDVVNSKFF